MKRKMVKKLGLIMMSVLMAVGMTGCGNQIPELPEEQAEKVGEYAVFTLLKYDANQRSRLVDMETIEAYDKKQQELKELQAAATPTPAPEGMKPVEDTPIVESEQTVTNTQAVMSVAESLSVPEGISVSYIGSRVCDTYPDDGSTDAYFSLDAAAGKKLLVLEFAVENESASDIAVDFFSMTDVYSVDVGIGAEYDAMATMLMNDLSTYAGTIPVGQQQNLVLLFEIDQSAADGLTELKLYFRNTSGIYTIQL